MTADSATSTSSNTKSREQLYRLIISQLFYDGYQSLAVSLSSAVQAFPPCPPSDKLSHVVALGLQNDQAMKRPLSKIEVQLGPGLDLEYETDVQTSAPEPALYETCYVTSHKAQCRAGAFSPDGQLVATGSVDSSIKILDVDRMLAKSSPDAAEMSSDQQGHPVIRTLYDHVEEINCLEFHPRESILASGSRDMTVKLFDFSKASAKKAFKTITDADEVRSLSFHPSGDYLVVGTSQPVIRLYDITTAQCFVSSLPSNYHAAGITCVKYSNDGKLYASSSWDGAIKIWDGVSSKCVATLAQAHEGAHVSSVAFSRSGKYLLSSGRDSLVRLWELATMRCLITYTGAGTMGKQEHNVQAIFSHTEDYVMFPDEATTSLCCWDSRTAQRKQLLSLGHNGAVRMIVHSPTSPGFLTCSDDYRARFWYRRVPH